MNESSLLMCETVVPWKAVYIWNKENLKSVLKLRPDDVEEATIPAKSLLHCVDIGKIRWKSRLEDTKRQTLCPSTNKVHDNESLSEETAFNFTNIDGFEVMLNP